MTNLIPLERAIESLFGSNHYYYLDEMLKRHKNYQRQQNVVLTFVTEKTLLPGLDKYEMKGYKNGQLMRTFEKFHTNEKIATAYLNIEMCFFLGLLTEELYHYLNKQLVYDEMIMKFLNEI